MFFGKKKNFELDLHCIGEEELTHWSILNVSHPDNDLIIKIRKSKPPIPDLAKYKTAVEIEWDYSEESTGMPPKETLSAMNDFEDAVEELSCYNNLSFMPRATLGAGLRAWLFYTKSKDEFMELFNTYLVGMPNLPLKISFYEDASWALWSEALEDHLAL